MSPFLKEVFYMKNKVYAVMNGRTPGVYYTYEECKEQIEGFSNQCFKAFKTEEEARAWLATGEEAVNNLSANLLRKFVTEIETSE